MGFTKPPSVCPPAVAATARTWRNPQVNKRRRRCMDSNQSMVWGPLPYVAQSPPTYQPRANQTQCVVSLLPEANHFGRFNARGLRPQWPQCVCWQRKAEHIPQHPRGFGFQLTPTRNLLSFFILLVYHLSRSKRDRGKSQARLSHTEKP